MNPTKVAGVPPDYFSKTGQLWGNPLYNWRELKKDNYKWWLDRIKATKELVDIIRIDHFRGFCAYWAVPFGSTTAVDGKWEKGPGADIFLAIKEMLGTLPILAEDLGLITPDVHALRDKFGFPSMKILEFAFDSHEGSSYIPHLLEKNSVVYTGTHDNDTVVGWFKKASAEDKALFMEYANTDDKNVAWEFIRLAFASVSDTAIVPMQDLLSLDSDSRMNTPSIASGNWQWRFKWEQVTPEIKAKLKRFTEIYQR
jgi:4-alpha-glucanotransferase